jgi:hypothetical protein
MSAHTADAAHPIGAMSGAAAFLAAVLLAVPSGPADAEWLIEMQVTDDAGHERPGRIYLDGDDLRIEVDQDPPVQIIYSDDGPALIHLDPAARTYTVMDRELASQVSGEMQAARRAMEAQLAALPPEQRAALERMMPQPPAASERPKLEVVRTDRSRQVDGRTCRVRELRRGTEVTTELCVIDWKEAGIGRTQLRAFREMARFQQDLVREAAGPFAGALESQPFDAYEELDGYPVETRPLRGAEGYTRMGLPRKQETDPARYRPPEGWSRRALVPGR